MESRRQNQKRTCERISKSGTGDKEDHREKDEVVRTCQEKVRRAHTTTKKNVRFTSTMKEKERKTEIQVERLV